MCVCVFGEGSLRGSAVTCILVETSAVACYVYDHEVGEGERGKEGGREGERERDSTSHQISSITKT